MTAGGDDDRAAAKLDRRRREVERIERAIAAARRRNERTYGSSGVRHTLGLIAAVLISGGVPGYLGYRDVISRQTMDWLIPLAMIGTFFGGMFGIFRFQNKDDAGAAESGATSPRGAADAGPSPPPAVEKRVSDLDGRERAARLHLMAEQRRPVTLLPSALPYLDLIIGGSLLVPLGIANIVFTIMMLTGNTKYDPMIWLAWPALLAGAGVMVAIRRRRAWRVRAFGGALDRLGAEIGAVRLASFDDAIGWLNRHWPGSHGASDLFKGAIYAGIAGSYRGYPVMVEIEPDGYTDEGGTIDPRVLLYVAALAPAAFPAGGEIAPLRASIRDAGFEPELLADAGLRARASEATVKRLRRTPAALAELAPVVRDLVRLAEACGAAPAPSA